jgi:hypothetical protein
MGSDAEPDATAGRVNCRNSHMTVGALAAECGFTDCDGSQLGAGATSGWRRPACSPTSLTSDDIAL